MDVLIQVLVTMMTLQPMTMVPAGKLMMAVNAVMAWVLKLTNVVFVMVMVFLQKNVTVTAMY